MFSSPMVTRNVPETSGPITPVASRTAEPSAVRPLIPSASSATSAKTIVACPSAKKKPT